MPLSLFVSCYVPRIGGAIINIRFASLALKARARAVANSIIGHQHIWINAGSVVFAGIIWEALVDELVLAEIPRESDIARTSKVIESGQINASAVVADWCDGETK